MSNSDSTVYLKLPGSVPDVLRIAAKNLGIFKVIIIQDGS